MSNPDYNPDFPELNTNLTNLSREWGIEDHRDPNNCLMAAPITSTFTNLTSKDVTVSMEPLVGNQPQSPRFALVPATYSYGVITEVQTTQNIDPFAANNNLHIYKESLRDGLQYVGQALLLNAEHPYMVMPRRFKANFMIHPGDRVYFVIHRDYIVNDVPTAPPNIPIEYRSESNNNSGVTKNLIVRVSVTYQKRAKDLVCQDLINLMRDKWGS